MLFWVPYLTVTSHSPGWGEQVVCGFLWLLCLEPFNLAGSFPCKTRLHSNALSLLPRALTATCWKHLPLTLTCYEVERSLNQSPGKKGCWSLETLVVGAAVGPSCMPLWTGMCRSTCLARAFAALPWNCSSSKPAISHPNERDFWMQRVLQCQQQRTLGRCLGLERARVSSGQQNQSTHAHLRIPVSLLQTEISQLSKPSWFAGKFSVLPLLFHEACVLLHLRGRGPMEPANHRAGVRRLLGPHQAGRSQACATTAGGF